MRPLLNKDFRRLSWLLRQEPPQSVHDYLIREVASLTKGGIDPRILSEFRNSLPIAELKMAHVIAILCFVSRMRLQDGEDTNAIPLTLQNSTALSGFFSSAALYGATMKRQADMLFFRGEARKWKSDTSGVTDELIEQKIVEGLPDLCTHVRVRVERLSAFFDLPEDLSLPPPPPVRSIWEMPPAPANPQGPLRTPSYHQRASGF